MKCPRLDDTEYFIYTGQEDVPNGVIHVRVHPSIKVICVKAFLQHRLLLSVECHNWLEVIEK
jgi:hypothetical protein